MPCTGGQILVAEIGGCWEDGSVQRGWAITGIGTEGSGGYSSENGSIRITSIGGIGVRGMHQ